MNGIKRWIRPKYIKKTLITLPALLVMLLFAFPIIWTIPFSLKPGKEVFQMALPGGSIKWLPIKCEWKNFAEVFKVNINGGTFVRALDSTAIVAVLGCFFSVFVNIFAAYGFARFNFRFKNFLWGYTLFFMFIPGIAIQLTSIKVVAELHMFNTIYALFVPGMANAYNIFFFRQFLLGIPDSIEEAARLDGASWLKMLFEIFMPMSLTPIIIIGIGAFMGAWNSYIWPTLVITQNEKSLSQVSQILFMMKMTNTHNYGVVIAACLIALVPPLVLFFIFQKQIIEGIAVSGLK